MPGLTSFAADVRSGVRALRKYPTLSIVAIVTLGLGLGLTTTVFCVVNGALFKGLPFEEPDRVVALFGTKPAEHETYRQIPAQDMPVWQSRQTVFEVLGAYDQTSINLSNDEGRPERVSAGQLSVAAFAALKVKPALGRGFEAGDDERGAQAVLLLGDDLWRKRFGASADIVNSLVRANGIPRRVIGVMPPKFGFPELESIWIPLELNPHGAPRGKGPDYQVIARLKPGATLAEARAQADAIATSLAQEFPQTNQGVGAEVQPFVEMSLGPEVYGLLYTMLAAGVGVLLIACVNVSNLLVARASLRRREVAVRVAIGAGRAQIIRQHLTEVLVLAVLGGVIGVGIGVGGVRWFNDALKINPVPFWMTFDFDTRVVLFVGGLIVLAALAAGTLPALHASRVNAGAVLKDDSRGSTSARLGRFSATLVVVELAVSCGLLIAAGLMTKTVIELRSIKLPFAIDNVTTMRVNLPHTQYPGTPARVRFCNDLLPHLQAIAGVAAATLAEGIPAAGSDASPIQIDGRAYAQDVDYPTVRSDAVMPGYFDTFQAAVLRGRAFTSSDDDKSERVAIVNDSFAGLYFAGTDPIGQRIRRGRGDATAPWLTIVGVVPDMKMQGLGNNEGDGAGFYVPIAQTEIGGLLTIAVRARDNGPAVTPFVRSALAAVDRDLPVYEVMTMREVIHREMLFYDIFGTFFVAFGASALFLAAAGLYGVMSFAVTQRTREMGVRAALGAPGGSLVLLVMRRSLVQLAIGLVLGLALGLFGSGPLWPVLYHVDPHDPSVAAIVVVVLTVAAVTASLLPALRVTRIDPTVALAAE